MQHDIICLLCTTPVCIIRAFTALNLFSFFILVKQLDSPVCGAFRLLQMSVYGEKLGCFLGSLLATTFVWLVQLGCYACSKYLLLRWEINKKCTVRGQSVAGIFK